MKRTMMVGNGKVIEFEEMEANATIIPTLPGYRVVWPQDDGTALFEDIIAWKISYEGMLVQPITPAGLQLKPVNFTGELQNGAILSPDGQVYIPGEGCPSWESLASYLREEKRKSGAAGAA
ncbi:MAG: hypothetical protein KKA22_03990 [Gammaproteobacteria bacterium]|nr:hypothetical protein [Gammaproteobacteria bacterium]MBU1407290.1 hypothetical protein [Gammaproteobacteria bacterium]MBU1531336.1 hypothetical protein [Gammaproteobacteria bacterium]